jgi:hypothetical protein
MHIGVLALDQGGALLRIPAPDRAATLVVTDEAAPASRHPAGRVVLSGPLLAIR